MVQTLVGTLGQFHYPLPGLLRDSVHRRSASITVGQGSNSLLSVPGQEPPYLAQGETNQHCCLLPRKLSSLYLVQHHRPLLFLGIQ